MPRTRTQESAQTVHNCTRDRVVYEDLVRRTVEEDVLSEHQIENEDAVRDVSMCNALKIVREKVVLSSTFETCDAKTDACELSSCHTT